MGRKAFDSWRRLSGVVCTYKPPDVSCEYVLYKLRSNICKDLNNLETRPPRKCLVANHSNGEISIDVRPSYADNVLCSGPRYQPKHIKIQVLNSLSELSSGVLLVGMNIGPRFVDILKRLSFTKCYHLKGILGQATHNFHTSGRLLAQLKYSKVQKTRFESILASYQSALQTRVFEEYGVPLKSQEAYNFAIKGLYRPVWNGPTIVYGLQLVEFEPPNFTIEVQCINEKENYLTNLIHNLGVSLKCYATCAGIRCIRNGCFHVEHSIPKNEWGLDNVIDNLKLTWDILEKTYPNKLKFSPQVTTYKSSESATQ